MTAPGVPPSGVPPSEVEIRPALVRALLEAQHPDLAGLPLRRIKGGWDNEVFRLGGDLAVRMPRRAMAAPLIVHEQRWLPELAPRLPLSVPAPVRIGKPGLGYPWAWSVVPWLPGRRLGLGALDERGAVALAHFLRALHVGALSEAPHNPYRSVPLRERSAALSARMDRLATAGVAVGELRRRWEESCEWAHPLSTSWIHGDLHPLNVLVTRGRVSGIIDWGDMAAGDPATDLAAGRLLVGLRSQGVFWDAYGIEEEGLRQRAEGWAVFFTVLFLDTGLGGDPMFAAVGARMLERLSEAAA